MASNFLRLKCKDCENEQTVFHKTASKVSCAVCGSTLAEPTGGKAKLLGQVVEVAEARE